MGVVVALAVLATAALLVADRMNVLDGRVVPLAVAAAVVLIGAGIVVSGLRGRTSGVLGFLAIVGILLGFPVAYSTHRPWSWADAEGHVAGTTDVTWTSRDQAADGFWLGVGSARLDLSEIELTTTPLDVPIRVAAGDVTIVVPPDAAVRAEVTTADSTVLWAVDDDVDRVSDVTGTRHFVSDEVADGTPAELVLTVDVGAGNVTITEEDR